MTDEFQEKYKVTSQFNWGASHFMQSVEGRERFENVFLEKYGVKSPLALKEIQEKAYESNLKNHGGVHSQTLEVIRDKAKQTWIEKYGVDNPSKAEEVKQKLRETFLEKYGVDNPFKAQEVKDKIVQTWIERYGCLPKPPTTYSLPNKLEQKFDSLTPEYVIYTGDFAYWIFDEETSKRRNPDFIVLSDDEYQKFVEGKPLEQLEITYVVELFGDYWHSMEKIGKDRDEHKAEVKEFYNKMGILCMVIWESELKRQPLRVIERLANFIEKRNKRR